VYCVNEYYTISDVTHRQTVLTSYLAKILMVSYLLRTAKQSWMFVTFL